MKAIPVPIAYSNLPDGDYDETGQIKKYARIHLPEIAHWNKKEIFNLACDVGTYLVLVSDCTLNWNKEEIYDCICYMNENNLDFDELGLTDSCSCGIDNPDVIGAYKNG